MGNPLSHVGQTARPEIPGDVQQHCEQVQQQQQGDQSQRQDLPGAQAAGDGGSPAPASREPPATRLPQHPQQQQDDPSQKPGGQQRIRQQGETHAEDTTLPSPTQAD